MYSHLGGKHNCLYQNWILDETPPNHDKLGGKGSSDPLQDLKESI